MPTPNTTPICPYFYTCGGCASQDVAYADQLAYKGEWLKSLFSEAIEPTLWRPIIGSPEEYPTYFRNKIRFAFVREGEKVFASRHQKGNEEADIPVERCYLQSPEADTLMNITADFATRFGWSLYSPTTRTGWLKHLLIREGKHTGELLVALVTDEGLVQGLDEWATALREACPKLKSIYHSRSWGANNTTFEDSLLWGESGFHEKVGDYTFWISPHSFFQTNGAMVETLYQTIGQMAELQGGEHLWDLYAGSATIGIFLSKRVGHVTSIESSPSNTADSRRNLELNQIENVTIHEGLVEDAVTSAFCKTVGLPDIVIVDPPRAGLHERFRQLLPNLAAKKIVYVSCNPVSCLRDLKSLIRSGYKVSKAQGIDMFPHSWHCELVLVLEKNTTKQSPLT